MQGDDGTGIRAVVNISFARLNCATPARRLFNSAIASSADCLVSAATPGSLATCSTALNSGVYLVPFAMVPSSPIELGEMRNKNQFISHLFCVFH